MLTVANSTKRDSMLVRAELEHINRLHHIGRQLSVLKRLYQSYELMIDRLLEKQEHSLASLKNSHVLTHQNSSGVESMASSVPQVSESQSVLGASLSSAARVRFERLKYRIRLYALSEIEECMNQKESLVMMVSPSQLDLNSPITDDSSKELQPHRHQRVLLC